MAAAVALLAVLAGCSSFHHPDASRPAGAVSAEPVPTERSAPPSLAASASPGGAAARGLADWPTEPVADKEAPEIKAAVIKPGYTGESALNRLTAAWGLSMEARQRVDFPGRPTVWHAAGSKRGGGTVTSIAAVWSLDGNLMSLSCYVTASVPRGVDFLRDCVDLDLPGAAPVSATAAWLDAVEPRVDSAFAAGHGAAVDSPLHRSGTAAAVLQRAHDESYGGDYYHLHVFGTGTG
ncbi:hypothetical protein [Kitasatospora sp. NPDC088134]|uniref:hypothetical protein n=1 Tax=Kitasatospora sp. NPDC088134 TaxID=3364071 RepID=UPI00382BE2F4